MHSMIKRLACFSFVLAVVHTLMGVCGLIYSRNYGLSFGESFVLTFYVIAGFVALIVLSCALWSLCTNLELEYESLTKSQRALRERIEALEFKLGR